MFEFCFVVRKDEVGGEVEVYSKNIYIQSKQLFH